MRRRAPDYSLLAFGLTMLFMAGCREVQDEQPSGAVLSAEERDVRAARAAQNRAIASNDLDSIASFWTSDVEIRRRDRSAERLRRDPQLIVDLILGALNSRVDPATARRRS